MVDVQALYATLEGACTALGGPHRAQVVLLFLRLPATLLYPMLVLPLQLAEKGRREWKKCGSWTRAREAGVVIELAGEACQQLAKPLEEARTTQHKWGMLVMAQHPKGKGGVPVGNLGEARRSMAAKSLSG